MTRFACICGYRSGAARILGPRFSEVEPLRKEQAQETCNFSGRAMYAVELMEA